MLSSEPAVYNQFLFKSIPYDPEKDFQPIANLFFNTLALVVNSDLKVKSLAGADRAREGQARQLSYATFSFPLTHFMEKLKKAEGIDIVKVPYRGGGEVVNALLGGSTPVALLALSNMVPQIQSGRITALAVNARVALAAVSRYSDTDGGAPRRRLSADLVRPVHADRRAAADRREDRSATSNASSPSPASASACISTARSSRRRETLDISPASSAPSASRASRSSRNPARSRSDMPMTEARHAQST